MLHEFIIENRERIIELAQLRVRERTSLEGSDSCGGLPFGRADEIFRPFTRRGSNHSGLGLGLSIARNAIRSSGGELAVRDVPALAPPFLFEGALSAFVRPIGEGPFVVAIGVPVRDRPATDAG